MRRPRNHLRHHAARRGAVPGHLAEHGREARDRPAARAPRRRRDRGGLPDRLARRLRGGAARSPARSRARSSPAWRALMPRTSTAPGKRYARPSDLGSTRSSRRRTSTSCTSCSPRARTSRARRAPPSRTPSRWSTTSSSRRWTPRAPTSSTPPRCVQIALDEGATTINIPDTVGYAMPHEYADVPRRGSTSSCPGCATSCCRCTATTTSGWPSRTRSPACRPARARSSARSTGSASAPATRRSRRS